jgi:cytochrome o ubiquinol oxidase operon protein cyoD
MSSTDHNGIRGRDMHDVEDLAPGEEVFAEHGIAESIRGYVIGFLLAAGLTIASFYIAVYKVVWPPAVPAALVTLAIAQMGIHLVFFLHIASGPDNTNNILALAFGILTVALVLGGSVWIMAHLDANLHMMHLQGPGPRPPPMPPM